ncbi:MAG: FmdE family protein [Synergistota bacterium]|jgi:formylmethanofuran dehydrogenase subunit E|nr:FmdE family protein [Synergistota bacterium]OPZ40456.1 MAG: FmdE, Molybdenum formylmethanofuran dehydrogenase operon [Synergistetes bacterium ADurb.BinA166]
MDQDMNLPEDLKRVVAFHGHFCPGILVGWRAARLAMRLLDAERDRDEQLVAVTENDACGVDAIQYLLGCTFGKGNLVFRDYGKHAYTVFRRSDGKGVRLVYRPAGRELTREESARRLLEEEDDVLFAVGAPREPMPDRAVIRTSAVCDICGETAMETRIHPLEDGRMACVPCREALRRSH